MSTLPLDDDARNRHLIYRLDAAEELALKQLTHAKAVLVRAGMSPDDSVLLAGALHAIVVNMQKDREDDESAHATHVGS